MSEPSVKIIVATHKKYRMPEDDMYLPLHVGAEGKTDENGNPLDLGFVKDNTGDNISLKNSSYCELTGLYWAWKNLEDADYIGLAHYRRHFSLKKVDQDPFDNVLTADQAKKIFETKKVIVPRKRRYYIETLYTHYAHTHYAEHLDETRKIIEEQCPDYLEDFDKVMSQRSGYMFNMMIMSRDLMDQYCSWLFPILFELENRFGDQDISSFQNRFYGRVSEIIFNVWLQNQMRNGALAENDIQEVSCIYMEKIDWCRKVKSFLKAKFFGRKYEGSF